MQNTYIDKNNMIYLDVRQVEPIKIELGRPMAGYLLINGNYRPLPLGSTLDLEKGVFYWLPAPGYYGTFQLVFALSGSGGQLIRKDVIVKIK
jgi:hypothetical protein